MNPRVAIHFDGWTLDTATGELIRGPERIRLQLQPQLVLEELLAHPGELVTREQLIARLWPRGIVDFDLSLNSAVRRLRVALGDHAESPRYIETIPRRGYRFIGNVATPLATLASVSEPAPVPPPTLVPTATTVTETHLRWRTAAAALLLIFASVGAGSLTQVDDRRALLEPADVRADGRAREHLVRAEFFMHRRMSGDFDRARENLTDALAIDPGFARAWAALASTYWLDTVEGGMSPVQGLPKVREAAERALALDPRLAEAHLRLSNYHWRTGNPRVAQEHLAAARALDPQHPLGLSIAAGTALGNGQLDSAIELQRRAVNADPLSLVIRSNLVAYLVLADRLDEAKVEMDRLQELSADAPGLASHRARTLLLEGRFDEALDFAATMSDPVERRFVEAIALHQLGDRIGSDRALQALTDTTDADVPVLQLAEVHAFRGEYDAAIALLRSAPGKYCGDASVQHSPFLRSLRTDPRWSEWITAGRRQASPRRVASGVG